jgi:ABC-type lipoprotein export system ATPase subunit
MRIESIHLEDVGPFQKRNIPFKDEWRGTLHETVLFSGPNGCGKSTVLRAVAHMWQMAGTWLSNPSGKSPAHLAPRKWLSQTRAVAVVFDAIGDVQHVGLFWGDPVVFEELKAAQPNVRWIGETKQLREGRGKRAIVVIHKGEDWIQSLSKGYSQTILNGGQVPNVIHLDGEERRWVKPTRGLAEVVPDDPALRWLTTYRPSEDWKGQLEASLIALKTIDDKRFLAVLDDINQYLKPKHIDPRPDPSSLRLQVSVPDAAKERRHLLDELSAGEHQVMIQLYMVSRWLQKGGLVLIDEVDLHLHPSLLQRFLDNLEALVRERNGQLLLTSHNPTVWDRYERKAHRIKLGE